MNSDKGPWNEYPGDEFGEASKAQLMEEEKKSIEENEETSSNKALSNQAQPSSNAESIGPIPILPIPAPISAEPSKEVHLMPEVEAVESHLEKSHSANAFDTNSIPITQAEPIEENKHVSEQFDSIDLNHL